MTNFSEYEKIIAFKAITDSSYLNSIADYIKPEYFEDDNIAEYFKIVTEFYDKRRVLPTFTEIKTYLNSPILRENFKKLLMSIQGFDKNLDTTELYENTERFIKERATACQLSEIGDNVEYKIKNPQEVLDAFDEICKINLNCETGIEIYRDIDLVIDDILNVEAYISSGWAWLDDALGGGYLEAGKSLYLFAGQANIGKSIFLGNVAANIAAQGKSVLVITLEMSEMVYAKRITSNITKIPMKDFKFNTHSLKSMVMDENKKNPEGKIFIKEFPPSTITPNKLSAFIKKLVDSGEHIDTIVIDYLSLLTTEFGSNSYEKIMHICEQVRAMSYIFKCPTVSALQLNREFFGKENPGMEGIAGSIGAAAVADVILSIFQTEEDQELGLIRLGMMKNRYGPRGMVQAMRIQYDTLTIVQSDEAEEIFGADDMDLLERLSNI